MKLVILVLFYFGAILAAPSEPATRIIGGRPAPAGAFPYHVSIRKNGKHICSGSIVRPEAILTAAHCLEGLSVVDMQVFAGTNYLNTGGVIHTPIRIHIHHSYKSETMINDIAVVRVLPPFKYNENVQAVPVPRLGWPGGVPETPAGSNLTLSGWGITSYPGNITNELQVITLTTLDRDECAASGLPNPITKENLCTTSPPNQGVCQGDSGAPLVDNEGYLRGIVSWGIPCARGKPDVFTNVQQFELWMTAWA